MLFGATASRATKVAVDYSLQLLVVGGRQALDHHLRKPFRRQALGFPSKNLDQKNSRGFASAILPFSLSNFVLEYGRTGWSQGHF